MQTGNSARDYLGSWLLGLCIAAVILLVVTIDINPASCSIITKSQAVKWGSFKCWVKHETSPPLSSGRFLTVSCLYLITIVLLPRGGWAFLTPTHLPLALARGV